MGVIVSSCSRVKSPGFKVLPYCFSLPTRQSHIHFLSVEKDPSYVLVSPSQWSVTQPRWDDHLSCIWWSSCFTRLQKKRELLPPFFIPASALAPESDVGPNDFTYLMPCHRVDGNKHLLCATWPWCLPAADKSDAAPGASHRHHSAFRLEMEETSADVQMFTTAEKNLNALLLTERRGRTGPHFK